MWASVTVMLVWQPYHDHINVGFAISATDNGSGAVTTQLGVFRDEPEVPSDSDDSNFSPDAKNIAAGTLRLRAERAETDHQNGRVYLARVTATASEANTSTKCVPVVVPTNNSAYSVSSVRSRAQAARSQSTTSKLPP